MKFNSYSDLVKQVEPDRTIPEREIVCVQGLGFVGIAMAVAAAVSRDENGEPHFNVIGVDLPTGPGRNKVKAINSGILQLKSSDRQLEAAFEQAIAQGNLIATVDSEALSLADYVLVDVDLDLIVKEGKPRVRFDNFINAIKSLGRFCRPGALIIVETTVPPGTCQNIVLPLLENELAKRGLSESSLYLAHAGERVMPGENYLDSIINIWRAYAGSNDQAADKCGRFLSKIINVEQYPLTRLGSMTASETTKVLENAYRAVNIAFIEEWGRFAEAAGVDLFEVVGAIRKRPTHSNIRQPGFGVGGYCLTKDPLFGLYAAREIFGLKELNFPFCSMAIEINNQMPLVTLKMIKSHFQGDLAGKKILLLGVAYRPNIGDTRHSPGEIFARQAIREGAKIDFHDPYLDYWEEMDAAVFNQLPAPEQYDVIVLAIPHKQYRSIAFSQWLKGTPKTVIVDANNFLQPTQINEIKTLGNRLLSIGRGN